jgi:hypothetical protein
VITRHHTIVPWRFQVTARNGNGLDLSILIGTAIIHGEQSKQNFDLYKLFELVTSTITKPRRTSLLGHLHLLVYVRGCKRHTLDYLIRTVRCDDYPLGDGVGMAFVIHQEGDKSNEGQANPETALPVHKGFRKGTYAQDKYLQQISVVESSNPCQI